LIDCHCSFVEVCHARVLIGEVAAALLAVTIMK
jgi:hypothetical protein